MPRTAFLPLIAALLVSTAFCAQAQDIHVGSDTEIHVPGVSITKDGVHAPGVDIDARGVRVQGGASSVTTTTTTTTTTPSAPSPASFTNANLRDTSFAARNMQNANFANADLTNINFANADLRNANFSNVTFNGGDLRGALVDGANFANATFNGTKIGGVDFSRANMANADFDGADYTTSATTTSTTITQALTTTTTGKPAAINLAINFASDSDKLEQDGLSQINELAKALNNPQLANAKFLIEGHTDSTSSDSHNLDLSKRRAQSVVRVLTQDLGIAPARLEAKWYGESKPVASNETEMGKFQNRRVTVVRVN